MKHSMELQDCFGGLEGNGAYYNPLIWLTLWRISSMEFGSLRKIRESQIGTFLPPLLGIYGTIEMHLNMRDRVNKRSLLWVRHAITYVEELSQTSLPTIRIPAPDKSQWRPPRKGWYKVNVDGAVFSDSAGSCGVGVIIRNEKGHIYYGSNEQEN